MKLSEAMRLGAQRRPQAFNNYFEGVNATCALGAALDGADPEWVDKHITYDGIEGRLIFDRLQELFPELKQKVLLSQMYVLATSGLESNTVATRFGEHTLWRANTFLNDSFHWSRERIADWLEAEGY